MVESGTPNDTEDNIGYPVLFQGIYSGTSRVVWLLLDQGAEVNLWDLSIHTALIRASVHGHTDIVKLLLR